MLVICPFYTYRTYLLHSRVSVGNLPVPFEIERGGHRFWVGDPAVAAAVNEMIPDLAALAQPGDELFVGPGDLAPHDLRDIYIYWLFPELHPGDVLHRDGPGHRRRGGLGHGRRHRSPPTSSCSPTSWAGWTEPNASSKRGSDEFNQAIADHFCLIDSYNTNLVLLFQRCPGGGGLDPADVAGRAGGIGGGGIDPGAG